MQLNVINGKHLYFLDKFEKLNPVLGENWHRQIINCNGDFNRIVHDTFRVQMKVYKGLKESVALNSNGVPP